MDKVKRLTVTDREGIKHFFVGCYWKDKKDRLTVFMMVDDHPRIIATFRDWSSLIDSYVEEE